MTLIDKRLTFPEALVRHIEQRNVTVHPDGQHLGQELAVITTLLDFHL